MNLLENMNICDVEKLMSYSNNYDKFFIKCELSVCLQCYNVGYNIKECHNCNSELIVSTSEVRKHWDLKRQEMGFKSIKIKNNVGMKYFPREDSEKHQFNLDSMRLFSLKKHKINSWYMSNYTKSYFRGSVCDNCYIIFKRTNENLARLMHGSICSIQIIDCCYNKHLYFIVIIIHSLATDGNLTFKCKSSTQLTEFKSWAMTFFKNESSLNNLLQLELLIKTQAEKLGASYEGME